MTSDRRTRALSITEDLVREYSRRGNYHSDAGTSAALGLPGLVVQGMQAAGPAYAELLDAWGDAFLEHGEIDVRFVGVVYAADRIEARVDIDDDGHAIIEVVTGNGAPRPAVVGRARRDLST